MDVILEAADTFALDRLYASSHLPRDSLLRQACSLYSITLVGIMLLYFTFATASYYLIFDHRMMKHPRFLKNQVKLEIQCSLNAFPVLDFLTLPWFIGEVRGHSLLYNNVSDMKGFSISPIVSALGLPSSWQTIRLGGGWAYVAFSCAFFLWFTDLAIYFVHRWEHHPALYKHIHKPHHKWIIPTPFASHAFHPLDGYAQSLPYHVFVYLFPVHKFTYMGLFVFVNLWSILIHDSEMIVDHPLEKIINGPSHHTLHHIHFTCNYGQYFTWADRVGGSYRHPVKGEDPLLTVIASQDKKRNKVISKSEGSTPLSTPLLHEQSMFMSSTSYSPPPSSSSSSSISDDSEHSDLEAELSSLLSAPKAGTLTLRQRKHRTSTKRRRVVNTSLMSSEESSACTSVDGDAEAGEKREL